MGLQAQQARELLLYAGARDAPQLLASHTEGEAVGVASSHLDEKGGIFLRTLVDAWRLCAYARRDPTVAEIEQLAQGYRVSFA